MMTEAELLTVAQVAARVNVDRETVRRWLRRGELPGVNIGRSTRGRNEWRIRPEALEHFLKEREQ